MSLQLPATYDLPTTLNIPGGLTHDEILQAKGIFTKLREKPAHKLDSDSKLWDLAITATIFTSEDFPEISGIMAYMNHSVKKTAPRTVKV